MKTGSIRILVRQAHASGILDKAVRVIRLSDEVQQRARALTQGGIKPLDALHLAFAAEAFVDYFCTCDDRLLKRARAAQTGETKVVSPLELIGELNQ